MKYVMTLPVLEILEEKNDTPEGASISKEQALANVRQLEYSSDAFGGDVKGRRKMLGDLRKIITGEMSITELNDQMRDPKAYFGGAGT